MTKYELEKEISKKIITVILYIQVLGLLFMVASPFIFIWSNWFYTWRIFVTGWIIVLIFHFVDKLVKQTVRQIIEQELKKPMPEKKSKFQEKLQQMIDDSKNNSK